MGNQRFTVAKDNLAQTSLLIALTPDRIKNPAIKLRIGVYANGRRVNMVNTVFIVPPDEPKTQCPNPNNQ